MSEQQVIEMFKAGHSRAIDAAGSGSYPQIVDYRYAGIERGGHLVEYIVDNGRSTEERGALYFDK